MSKHTPGKWKVGFNDGTGKSYITDPEGRVVVRGGFDSRGVKHGVLKASDARLIAAAPDLLEALQLARQELAGLPHSLGYNFTHIPKIDAAIAKATAP